MKIAVIGAGAAGMIAAIELSKKGHKVSLFEKNEKVGRKIYITGKGRCNLTNDCDVEETISKINSNPFFMYSALYSLDSRKLMKYFEDLGVKLKVERGNRVYPMSNKATDIIDALLSELRKRKVDIYFSSTIKDIKVENSKVKALVYNDDKVFEADKIVLATGGVTYPSTGSSGEGHKIAESLGHKVTGLYPALVPLIAKDKWIRDLAGLSLRNVAIDIKDEDGKEVYKDFGEMMFTHINTVTGPVILSASRQVTVGLNAENKTYKLSIDLKPALSLNELEDRVLRDFEKYLNKDFRNALDDLLPQKIINTIMKLSEIDPDKKVNSITKEERKRLVYLMKNLTCQIVGTMDMPYAVVTVGGVDVSEIDPSNMQSKLIEGLYFAGELIDVDAYTGGFNLQLAFSCGYLVGNSI